MRKLLLKMHVSVDGFVGGPNGQIDWTFKSQDEATAAYNVARSAAGGRIF